MESSRAIDEGVENVLVFHRFARYPAAPGNDWERPGVRTTDSNVGLTASTAPSLLSIPRPPFPGDPLAVLKLCSASRGLSETCDDAGEGPLGVSGWPGAAAYGVSARIEDPDIEGSATICMPPQRRAAISCDVRGRDLRRSFCRRFWNQIYGAVRTSGSAYIQQAQTTRGRVVWAGGLAWTSFSFNETRFTISRRAILSGFGLSR